MTIIVPARTFKRHAADVTKRHGLDTARRRVADLGVYKVEVGAPVARIEGKRVLRFTITTGAVDREGDKISVKGWETRHFEKNPVVLWAHDSFTWPIGRAFDLENDGKSVAASVEFIPPDMRFGEAGQRADVAYNLAAEGWISATSVGFVPLEWEFTNDVERGGDSWFPGIDFLRQELCEFSLCTVPANPEALIDTPVNQDADKQQAITARARRRRLLQLLEIEGATVLST